MASSTTSVWRQGVEPVAAFGHRAEITIGPKIITLTVKIVKLNLFTDKESNLYVIERKSDVVCGEEVL